MWMEHGNKQRVYDNNLDTDAPDGSKRTRLLLTNRTVLLGEKLLSNRSAMLPKRYTVSSFNQQEFLRINEKHSYTSLGIPFRLDHCLTTFLEGTRHK